MMASRTVLNGGSTMARLSTGPKSTIYSKHAPAICSTSGHRLRQHPAACRTVQASAMRSLASSVRAHDALAAPPGPAITTGHVDAARGRRVGSGRFGSSVVCSAAPSSSNMAATSYPIVVVGGGNASGYFAKTVLEGGATGLCILGDEPVVAYERPALSKAYLAPEGAARLPGFHTTVGGGGERQTAEWYEQKGVTYRTSTHVTAVDLAAKKVTTSAGETISYEKLVIATGARALLPSDMRMPGADLQGVVTLRNEADAAKLVLAIKEVKASGGQAVVIGGGYIGLECSAALATNGIPTTQVFPEDRALARLFTPQIATWYEKFYAKKGITLVKGSLIKGMEGEGKVSHVVVAGPDGVERRLPAALVIVGVGARPNVELFAGQLEMAAKPVGGIQVDGHMATSVKDVYAIGDVAAFPLKLAGGTLARQEHVAHCRSSAAQAAKAILGQANAPYDYTPYFYSRVFNLSWQFWGLSSVEDQEAQVVHFGDFSEASTKFGAYWVAGGKVIGVFLEGATPDEAAAAKKLASEQPASPGDSLATQGISFAVSRM